MSWWERGGAAQVRGDVSDRQSEWDAVVSAFAGKDGVGWLRAPCPLCEEASGTRDKKESLGFNTKTGGFNCLKCGVKGRLPESYLEQLEHLVDLDLNDEGRQVVVPVPPEPAYGFTPLFSLNTPETPGFERLREYARGRGIPDETARAMGIGTGTGPLAGRIVVPIVDASGTYRGWYGRDATGEAFIAHRYAKNMARDGLLFNDRQIAHETNVPLFVVEGCLKCVPVWPHAVATLGKPLDSHIAPLLRARRPIVVCLDGDAWRDGQSFAWDLEMRGARVENVVLPPKTDPDDLTREDLFARAAAALGDPIARA